MLRLVVAIDIGIDNVELIERYSYEGLRKGYSNTIFVLTS